MSDWYGVKDAACPISTRGGGGGGGARTIVVRVLRALVHRVHVRPLPRAASAPPAPPRRPPRRWGGAPPPPSY